MADFDPVAILRALHEQNVQFVVVGGIAARLRGAPLLTQDVDVTPSRTPSNLESLARALEGLEAHLRTAAEPDGVHFPFHPELLESSNVWTLATKFGDLDLVMSPAGTDGYPDLLRDADDVRVAIDPELTVSVISLADVIRSKEAAAREKDRAALPLLRRTLDEMGP